jgi:putative transport protein
MELHGVAQALLVLAATAAAGLVLGEARLAGVKLGVGGALFAGLALGHFGIGVDATMLQFVREFGLVLFVYTVGVSAGPGFFQSFRRDGLAMNGLAAAVVLLGTGLAVLVHVFAGVELPAVLGILAGATTNTPSLAAGQQVLRELGAGEAAAAIPGTAYAVAYPFGILGILLAMLVVRGVFRVSVRAEAKDYEATRGGNFCAIETVNVEVRNPAVIGCRLRDLDELKHMGVVLSRVLHDGSQHVVHADDVLAEGDVVLAVGPARKLAQLQRLVGPLAAVDLKAMKSSDVVYERMVVTNSAVLGKTLGELDLRGRHQVVVSRVDRAGHQLVAEAHLGLQFGDLLTVVGEPEQLVHAAKLIGNRSKALQETQMVPVFIGIALGVLLGSIPIAVPGLPAAVKLGLAGGPLIAAILLSRLGHAGPLVWFMPPAANHVMKDFGIALFLAAVGLKAGGTFVHTLVNGQGLAWMGWGALVTLLPLLVVGVVGRHWLKLNYLSLCGLLAGSMTDPPALAFAQGLSSSSAAVLAYSSVYPLVMVLRVVAPQVVALLLWG